MIENWTSWKRFQNARRGEPLAAPVGPGIYEVRHISSGDLAAFDASANIADALTGLLHKPRPRSWKNLFAARRPSWRHHDLEYRTAVAASVEEAKMMAQCLLGRRQAYWRRSAIVSRATIPA